jgi:hypothetical protein
MRYRHLIFCGAAGCTAVASSGPSATPAVAANDGIIARYQIGGNELGYDYMQVDAAMRAAPIGRHPDGAWFAVLVVGPGDGP